MNGEKNEIKVLLKLRVITRAMTSRLIKFSYILLDLLTWFWSSVSSSANRERSQRHQLIHPRNFLFHYSVLWPGKKAPTSGEWSIDFFSSPHSCIDLSCCQIKANRWQTWLSKWHFVSWEFVISRWYNPLRWKSPWVVFCLASYYKYLPLMFTTFQLVMKCVNERLKIPLSLRSRVSFTHGRSALLLLTSWFIIAWLIPMFGNQKAIWQGKWSLVFTL